MTIREYISQKFKAFGDISEAELLDMSISGGFSAEDEYSEDIAKAVGVAMTEFIGEKVLSPYVKSVSESGFSISWDFSKLGNYYLWLCRKWGITPDDKVLGILGLSVITDKSNLW